MFVFNNEVEKIDLAEGMSRKILARGGNMMLVEAKFEEGTGMPNCHTHEHEQITYVTKGSVEFVCDGETKILNEGDSIYVAPNLEHTVSKAFEDSIILDIFAPQREDFLK